MGQGLLVHRYTEELARHGVVTGQVLLTLDDVTRRAHYRNAYQTFAKLLELGVLPIVNENDTVATTEIRFGDNDRLAALVAHLVHADLLVLLSDVDGLYDAAPGAPRAAAGHRRARRRGRPRRRRASAGPAAPASAPAACRPRSRPPGSPPAPGIPVVLTAAEHAAAALAGEPVGTLFHATGKRRPTRLLWLAHATEPQGTLVLDDGAVRAVDRAPGLAARRRHHRGRRAASSPATRSTSPTPTASPVARGLVNFDADRAARPARALLARPQARARCGVRARGRAPRRPRPALIPPSAPAGR